MRKLVSLLLFFIASSCLAADPVSLILKALGPLPLEYDRPEPVPYEAFQNHALLPPTLVPLKRPIVQTFLYNPAKFDDLAARYELNQTDLTLNHSLLLRGDYDQLTTSATMDKVLKEYLRRIYQGYSVSMTEESRKKQRLGEESLFDVGRNIIVNYQAIRLSNSFETRIGYDVIANAMHFKLVTPVFDSELAYFLVNQPSPASIPENVRTVDEAMDEFTRFDRTTASVAHTFSGIGLRLKAKYGLTDQTIDYGFSKVLCGPLGIQVVREENRLKDAPDFLAVQLTLGKRF